VRLLLDTHIAIWALTDDPQLSATVRGLIASQDNQVFVSAVTVWEIAIKHALQRYGVPFSGNDALGYFADAGYEWLDVTPAHAAATETLPPLHADPFDRLLIAQAMIEPLRLVTHDATLASYSDTVLLT
jgi:PIN domain nuclease of toxin-antitoxin system